MSALAPLELVVSRLDGSGCNPTPHGDRWQARCPAHDDRNPSLSITTGDDGRALLKCHAGCDLDAVLAALQLDSRDLFVPAPNGSSARTIVATYPYVDADGRTLFEVVRYDPKDFRQRRPDGTGGWRWKLDDLAKGVITPRVLYRLPQVLDAVAGGHLVWIVEGEKDADALQAVLPEGEVATCNPMGAGKWRPEHTKTLEGAGVMVWADADSTGRAHALEVATALRPVAAAVHVIESPRFKDPAEHLGAGLTLDDIIEIDPDEPSPTEDETPDVPTAIRARILTSSQLAALPAPEYLIDGLVPADALTMLYGSSSAGKSFLALGMAASLALGTEWYGRTVQQTNGLYIAAESPNGLGQRLAAWTQHNDRTLDELDGRLHWHPRAVNIADYAPIEELVGIIGDLDIGLVVIDTLARSTAGAEENSAKDMGRVIDNADRLRHAGAAVILVHHTGKDEGRGGRGSSALRAGVDAELELIRHADDTRTLKDTKQKNTVEADPINLKLIPVGPSAVLEVTASAGPFRPTTIMERVSLELALSGKPRSKRHLRSEVRGKNEWIDRALEVLAAEGYIERGEDGYQLLRPYTASTDDPANQLLESASRT